MIAIKDIEMPKSCAECRMKKRCEQGIAGGWIENKRVDDCPLVEVPTVTLDRIKAAREEMVNGMPSIRTEGQLTGDDVVFSTACECYAECIMILDKLIAEVEE